MDDDDVIVIIIIMDFKTYTTVLLSVDILMFKRSILHLLGLLVSVFSFCSCITSQAVFCFFPWHPMPLTSFSVFELFSACNCKQFRSYWKHGSMHNVTVMYVAVPSERSYCHIVCTVITDHSGLGPNIRHKLRPFTT